MYLLVESTSGGVSVPTGFRAADRNWGVNLGFSFAAKRFVRLCGPYCHYEIPIGIDYATKLFSVAYRKFLRIVKQFATTPLLQLPPRIEIQDLQSGLQHSLACQWRLKKISIGNCMVCLDVCGGKYRLLISRQNIDG